MSRWMKAQISVSKEIRDSDYSLADGMKLTATQDLDNIFHRTNKYCLEIYKSEFYLIITTGKQKSG